jgi:hypothetical protein
MVPSWRHWRPKARRSDDGWRRCARCAGTGSAPDRVGACIRLTPRDAAPGFIRSAPPNKPPDLTEAASVDGAVHSVVDELGQGIPSARPPPRRCVSPHLVTHAFSRHVRSSSTAQAEQPWHRQAYGSTVLVRHETRLVLEHEQASGAQRPIPICRSRAPSFCAEDRTGEGRRSEQYVRRQCVSGSTGALLVEMQSGYRDREDARPGNWARRVPASTQESGGRSRE